MEKSTLKNMKFGREKLKNIWFFYKKAIIAGAAVLVVGVFLLAQCFARTDYDLNIYFAGPKYLTSDAQKSLGDAFAAVIGEEHAKKVGFVVTVIGDSIDVSGTEEENRQFAMNYTGQKETMSDFKARMRLPDTVICLLSPDCFYEAVKDTGTLRSLYEILPELPGESAGGGYGVRLSSLPFYKSNSILKALPEDTLICVKSASIFRSDDEYERQIAAFVGILTYRGAGS